MTSCLETDKLKGFMDMDTDFSIESLGQHDTLRFIELCEQKNIRYSFTTKKISKGFIYLKELNVVLFNKERIRKLSSSINR